VIFILVVLQNDYMTPFVSAVGAFSGQFDNMECLGEFLTRYDATKGAVGYLGTSRHSGISYGSSIQSDILKRPQQERLPHYLFNDTISIAGE